MIVKNTKVILNPWQRASTAMALSVTERVLSVVSAEERRADRCAAVSGRVRRSEETTLL
jgi:hypothetical protein